MLNKDLNTIKIIHLQKFLPQIIHHPLIFNVTLKIKRRKTVYKTLIFIFKLLQLYVYILVSGVHNLNLNNLIKSFDLTKFFFIGNFVNFM